MRSFFKQIYPATLGQTLVEIMVVIGVIAILTTGLVVLTTFSIKNSRISALRSQAVKYAAQGMEYVRQKRDAGWTDFQALGGQTWCLGDNGAWVPVNPICLENVSNLFGRTIEFTWDEANHRMAVTVTVDWNEGAEYYETHLNSYFTQWQ